MRSAGVPTSAPQRLSPEEAGDRPGVFPGGARQPEAVVGRTSRLPETAPPAEPETGREQPSAPTTAGSEASGRTSCQEQLSFGPKAFSIRGLAVRPQGAQS
jgi:hypothetical protein